METVANKQLPKPEETRSTPPGSPPTIRRGATYDLTSESPSSSTTSSPVRTFHDRQQHVVKLDGRLPPNMHPHPPRMEASFPVRLHQLLSTSDGRVIRWQPKNDGKSFTILNCDAFEAQVLPRLYRSANIEVFGQLLSLYGFQRVENGPYEGDYYHSMFVRDKPQLAHMIRKGGNSGPVANPTVQPTSYSALPPPMMQPMAMKHSMANSMRATVMSRLANMNFPGKLHYLLCHGIYDLGLEGIMRWQPGGHAFAVYSSEEFEMQGLAEMLGTPGHASFRAQLFLHGFQRVRSDCPDVEAYYHAEFVREQPHLCRLIRSRNHMKSSMIRRTTVPTTPLPHRQPLVSPLSDTSMKSTISAVSDSLFIDSRSSFHLTPESRDRRASLQVPSHVPVPPICIAPKTEKDEEKEAKKETKKDESKPRKRPRVGQMMPQTYFPFKLHSLLTLAEKFGLQHILCWSQHGRCFSVNDKDAFCATILPLFRHSEFASFRAQLKAYGFVRLSKSGPDKGAYFHCSFLRGRPEMCATITRRPKNVNGHVRGRPKGRKDVEPDFFRMKFMPALDVTPTAPPPGDIKDVLEMALTQITPPAVVTREISVCYQKEGRAAAGAGISISDPKDASEVVAKLVRQNDGIDTPLPVKLHALLNEAHDHAFNRVVTWNDSGRSFVISDEQVFGEDLCEKWLNIPSLVNFQEELQSYGFKLVEEGPHKGSYYHEMFHKALPHLCRCIKKETNGKALASDSSIESEPVIEVDGGPTSLVENMPRLTGSSFSTGSLGSVDKRTNSPELEVAIALTAMDDRSAGEGRPPVEEARVAVSSRGDEAPNENSQAGTIEAPCLPPLSLTPSKSQSSVNKRKSLDPPACCDMLLLKEQMESCIKEGSTEPVEGDNMVVCEASQVDHDESAVDSALQNTKQTIGEKSDEASPEENRASNELQMEMIAAAELLNMEIDFSRPPSVKEEPSIVSDQPPHASPSHSVASTHGEDSSKEGLVANPEYPRQVFV